MRTIDADVLMNELIRLGYAYSNDEQRAVVADCIECVEEAPTVKAMEATRCRDCVNCQSPVPNWWYCKMTGLTVTLMDFAAGEKEKEKTNDRTYSCSRGGV